MTFILRRNDEDTHLATFDDLAVALLYGVAEIRGNRDAAMFNIHSGDDGDWLVTGVRTRDGDVKLTTTAEFYVAFLTHHRKHTGQAEEG